MRSHAEALWTGDLLRGQGVATLGSGIGGELPVSWSARTEAAGGKTCPEELIAAAHASCYSMAFAHELAQAGQVPKTLHTSAECSFEQREVGWRIAAVRLSVEGNVPGCDQETFTRLALAARDGCPVSLALAGNVEISVASVLEV